MHRRKWAGERERLSEIAALSTAGFQRQFRFSDHEYDFITAIVIVSNAFITLQMHTVFKCTKQDTIEQVTYTIHGLLCHDYMFGAAVVCLHFR